MRLATSGLLVCVTLGVPLVASACGGTVGQGGGGDGGAHPDAGKPDVVTSHHRDSGMDRNAPDAREVSTSPTYPAPHPRLPTVQSYGGPTLVNPNYVPITFPSDPNQSDIVAFASGIGKTMYWSTLMPQYGVGPATSGTPLILMPSEEPSGIGGTIDDTAIQPWLQSLVEMGRLGGTNGPNTAYAVFFPAGTTITLMGQTSCVSMGGYHNAFNSTATGKNITYVVVPRCSAFPTASGTLTGVAAITGPASHEFIESATDPEPLTVPAYATPDDDDIIWELILGGGEIGDMCVQFPGAFYQPTDFPYVVQRGWSNSAALAGHNPCQPDEPPGQVYFNSVPVLTKTTVDVEGRSIATSAVTVPLHKSVTVEVDLYSDGATAPWSVQAVDAQELTGGAPALSFAWDKTTGENGDKLHLTITADSTPSAGVDAVVIVSEGGTLQTFSIGMVLVQ